MRPRALARRALAAALLPAARLHARLRPGVRILMYHRVDRLPGYDQLTVTPERFARHVAYLARHCRPLSLADAVDELERGPSGDAVVVTLDDGYRDNLVHALPALRRHGVPATLFVTAAFCDQARRHPRYPAGDGRLHLDWEELRALASDPLVTIGSHALTHPHLRRLSAAAAREEIGGSRERIARELGRPVEFFCYPSGDLGPREVELVRAAGYRAAVTVAPGANRRGTPPLELRRTEVTDRDDDGDLRAKLSGAYDPVHLWLHRARTRRFEAEARAEQAPAAPGAGP